MPFQLTGPEAIRNALSNGQPLQLVLVRRGDLDPDVHDVVELARARGIPIRQGGEADIRRMRAGTADRGILALAGRNPGATLDEVLAGEGAVWLLAGVAYSGNAGFCIRTVEVSGAAAVAIDGLETRKARHVALRASMHADRFMPVFWEKTAEVVRRAKAAGRRVVAFEDCGDRAPWDVDLTGRTLLIVGGEQDGVPPEVLADCDAVTRIPMPGFIPSYNIQAALSAACFERLRQVSTLPTGGANIRKEETP